MKILDLLRLSLADIDPRQTKVHLAGQNRSLDAAAAAALPPDQLPSDPLEEFHAGGFDPWQARQSRRNFERPRVLSWIQLDPGDRWLFAGVYDVDHAKTDDLGPAQRLRFRYRLTPRPELADLVGRLIAGYKRSGRASYRNAETMIDEMRVAEILATRHRSRPFPGYQDFVLTRAELQRVVRYDIESWRVGLGAVAGVYLITDSSDQRMYVGSATGKGGFWGRWCTYAKDPTGGNVRLRKLLATRGDEHASHFRYAILETASTAATPDEVLRREAHWKLVLGTRAEGLNAN